MLPHPHPPRPALGVGPEVFPRGRGAVGALRLDGPQQLLSDKASLLGLRAAPDLAGLGTASSVSGANDTGSVVTLPHPAQANSQKLFLPGAPPPPPGCCQPPPRGPAWCRIRGSWQGVAWAALFTHQLLAPCQPACHLCAMGLGSRGFRARAPSARGQGSQRPRHPGER